MPDLANLFRIDHLIKFEIPTIFLRRIVFANYNYNVYLLPPSFQSSNIFVEKKKKEILLG